MCPGVEHHDRPDAGFALLSRPRSSWALCIRRTVMRRSRRDGLGPATGRSIYQIKVTLLRSRPAIWRRLQVENGITLGRLHDTLQMVMGWTNSHLHGFRRLQPSQKGTRRRLLPIESADEKATRPGRRLTASPQGLAGLRLRLRRQLGARRFSLKRSARAHRRHASRWFSPGTVPVLRKTSAAFLATIISSGSSKTPTILSTRTCWSGPGRDFDPTAFDVQEVNRAFHGGWGPRRPGRLTSR